MCLLKLNSRFLEQELSLRGTSLHLQHLGQGLTNSTCSVQVCWRVTGGARGPFLSVTEEQKQDSRWGPGWEGLTLTAKLSEYLRQSLSMEVSLLLTPSVVLHRHGPHRISNIWNHFLNLTHINIYHFPFNKQKTSENHGTDQQVFPSTKRAKINICDNYCRV